MAREGWVAYPALVWQVEACGRVEGDKGEGTLQWPTLLAHQALQQDEQAAWQGHLQAEDRPWNGHDCCCGTSFGSHALMEGLAMHQMYLFCQSLGNPAQCALLQSCTCPLTDAAP